MLPLVHVCFPSARDIVTMNHSVSWSTSTCLSREIACSTPVGIILRHVLVFGPDYACFTYSHCDIKDYSDVISDGLGFFHLYYSDFVCLNISDL